MNKNCLTRFSYKQIFLILTNAFILAISGCNPSKQREEVAKQARGFDCSEYHDLFCEALNSLCGSAARSEGELKLANFGSIVEISFQVYMMCRNKGDFSLAVAIKGIMSKYFTPSNYPTTLLSDPIGLPFNLDGSLAPSGTFKLISIPYVDEADVKTRDSYQKLIHEWRLFYNLDEIKN